MEFFRTVILVDDDLDDHEVFTTACSVVDNSIRVTGFENGEQALQAMLAADVLPDVLFLDLNMPRFNGIEVLETLRQTEKLKSVPVIVYTTSFDERVKDQCLQLGALDVIEKPNSFDALCARLGDLLRVSV